MLLPLDELELLNKSIPKAEGKITRKEAKAVHKDLPPNGHWVTIKGHHVYIVDGKVVAGSLPWVNKKGEVKAKKATKAHLKLYQEHIDKKEAKKKASEEVKAEKKAKKTATKKTTKKAEEPKKVRPRLTMEKNPIFWRIPDQPLTATKHKYKDLPKILKDHDEIEVHYYAGQEKQRVKQLQDLGYELKENIHYNPVNEHSQIRQVWVRKKASKEPKEEEKKTTTKKTTKKTTEAKEVKTKATEQQASEAQILREKMNKYAHLPSLRFQKVATLIQQIGNIGKVSTHKYKDLPNALKDHDEIMVEYPHEDEKRRTKLLQDLGYELKDEIWRETGHTIKQVWTRKKTSEEPRSMKKSVMLYILV